MNDLSVEDIEAASGISVAVRVRPLQKRELRNDELAITFNEHSIIANIQGSPQYSFDHVLGTNSTNQDAYEAIGRDVIESSLIGINATIFAYGQTSTGKTHTMFGSNDDPGVMRMAVSDVFRKIAGDHEREYLVRASYMEIYNEIIKDLLKPGSTNLKVHQNTSGEIFVGDITEKLVSKTTDVFELLEFGDRSRHVGETNMNEQSSRSHTIFRLVIESRKRDGSGGVRVSLLNMVDLAGSERVAHTGAEGQRLIEGGHINKSLLSLGTVISKLADGDTAHVPYRDSKLTRILQSSLGGNARTSIICTVTPASMHIDETLSTLRFANRAKRIKNRPQVNEHISEANQIKLYQREILDLKRKLEEMITNASVADTNPSNESPERIKRRKTLPEEKSTSNLNISMELSEIAKNLIDAKYTNIPLEFKQLIEFLQTQKTKMKEFSSKFESLKDIADFSNLEYLSVMESYKTLCKEIKRCKNEFKELNFNFASEKLCNQVLTDAFEEILLEQGQIINNLKSDHEQTAVQESLLADFSKTLRETLEIEGPMDNNLLEVHQQHKILMKAKFLLEEYYKSKILIDKFEELERNNNELNAFKLEHEKMIATSEELKEHIIICEQDKLERELVFKQLRDENHNLQDYLKSQNDASHALEQKILDLEKSSLASTGEKDAIVSDLQEQLKNERAELSLQQDRLILLMNEYQSLEVKNRELEVKQKELEDFAEKYQEIRLENEALLSRIEDLEKAISEFEITKEESGLKIEEADRIQNELIELRLAKDQLSDELFNEKMAKEAFELKNAVFAEKVKNICVVSAELKDSIREMNDAKTHLSSLFEETVKSVEHMKSLLNESGAKVASLKNEIEAKIIEKNELELLLTESKSAHDRSCEELFEVKNKEQAAVLELGKAEAELLKARAEIIELNQITLEYKRVKDELETERLTKETISTVAEEARNEIQLLKIENESLRKLETVLGEKESQIKELNQCLEMERKKLQQIDTVEKTLQEAHEQLKVQKQENDDLSLKLQGLYNLQAELNEEKQKNENLATRFADYEALKEKFKLERDENKKLQGTQTENAKLKVQLQDERALREKWQVRVEMLQVKLETLKEKGIEHKRISSRALPFRKTINGLKQYVLSIGN